MVLAPLARDQQDNPFDLPPEAAYWRVRRHTGGRPSTVLDGDGEPLFIPVNAGRADLREQGCAGSLRLEAVDSDHKSVHAPVAFVELGVAHESTGRSGDAPADLVRTSFEAMTRTMEAMQRAQVERERALAQKERALTDAQVAAQRMNVDLMIALLDRAGGKPQDPIQVLKQQLAFQKALDAGSHRNSTELPAPIVEVDEKEPANDWLTRLKPLTPVVSVALQELIVNHFAKGDEAKAEAIRKSFSSVGGMLGLGSDEATAVRQVVQNAYAEGFASQSPTVANESSDERLAPPKAMRELLAQLSDDEAEAFLEHLGTLDGDQLKRVCADAAAIAKLEERTAWARELLRKRETEKAAAKADPVSSTAAPFDVPPALIPILSQLSPTEMQVGASIIGVLDRATIQKLADRLLAMPPDQALATIRRTIAEAQRRSASVAHRAVAAALNTDGAQPGGGAA